MIKRLPNDHSILFFGLFNKVFDKSTEAYTGLVRFMTRRIAIGVVFILVLTGGMGGNRLPGGFMPSEDMGYLMVNAQLPDAASLQRSDAVVKKVEKIIGRHPEVEYVATATGFSLISGSMSFNAGFAFVALKDWRLREKTAEDLVGVLNREFFMGINEAQVFAFGPPAIPGLGNGSGFTLQEKQASGTGAIVFSLWPVAFRCRHQGGPSAFPAHPDDRLFFHFGCFAPGRSHRRRCPGQGGDWYGAARGA